LKNVVTLKSGQRSLKFIESVTIRYIVCGFLLVFFSNFVPKMHRFWDIWLGTIQWPWNPGMRSLKVIENDTIRSGTHDFLLMFHGNHWPISHRFRDKQRFPLKIANFSHPMYLYPSLKGLPFKLGIGAGS